MKLIAHAARRPERNHLAGFIFQRRGRFEAAKIGPAFVKNRVIPMQGLPSVVSELNVLRKI